MAANRGSRDDADQDRRFSRCPRDAGESAGQFGGRSLAVGRLATALADAGDAAAAVEVAHQITAGTGFDQSVGMAAAAIYRAGEVDSATKLLEGIDDLSERARAYHVAGRTHDRGWRRRTTRGLDRREPVGFGVYVRLPWCGRGAAPENIVSQEDVE